MPENRPPTQREREEKVRDIVLNRMQGDVHAQILIPTVVDQDHPAFIMGVEDGLYLVRLQKVSAAVAEHTQIVDSSVQP